MGIVQTRRNCIRCLRNRRRRHFRKGGRVCVDCRRCPTCEKPVPYPTHLGQTCGGECEVVARRAAQAHRKRPAPPGCKFCPSCGETPPADEEHWPIHARNADGSVARLAAWCRGCTNAYQRDKYATLPERQRRARLAARAQRDRIERRRREDPEFDLEWRRRQAGYQAAYKARKAARAGRTVQPRGPEIPTGPLVAAIQRAIDRQEVELGTNGATAGIVCARLGVSDRNWYAWRTGERERVRLETADRVLVELGLELAEVYVDVPGVAEWAGAATMPPVPDAVGAS